MLMSGGNLQKRRPLVNKKGTKQKTEDAKNGRWGIRKDQERSEAEKVLSWG